jgi:hypothetical protein
MASNEEPTASRGRVVGIAIGLALVLAAGAGWLKSRPTDAPARTAGESAAAPAPYEPLRPEAKAEAAAAPPSAAAPLAASSPGAGLPPPAPRGTPADELRKVQMALQGGATPKEMLAAATLLSACPHADQAVEAMYHVRDQPTPEMQALNKATGLRPNDMIAQQQDLQRRCQAFDAATLARSGELFKRAYDGGAEGSALPYLQWLNGEGKREANPELLARLQREARQSAEDGDFMALNAYSLAFDPAPLGATPLQRQAYKEAFLRIQAEMGGPAMEKAMRGMIENVEKSIVPWGAAPPPLGADQQREADALARRVVDAWRKRQSQGG